MRVLRPILAAGILGLLASPILAQERYATVSVRAGYTFPLGAAKDTLKGQSSFGGDAAIALSDRLHLGVSVDWAHHSQKPVIGGAGDQQWNVVHAFLKASYNVVNGEKISFALNAGPGIMVFSPNDTLKATGKQNDLHFAVNGGATLTYWFSDRIGLLGSFQADMALKKTKGQIFKTSSGNLFPITGGFAFKI